MVYNRKPKRMSKRRLMRKKRRFNISKPKPYQTKYVRMTRWSSLDSTNNVHVTLAGLAGGSIIGNTVFRLSDTSGYAEIRNLFDNFCVRRVLYRWVLTKDPAFSTAVSGSAGIFPRLTWVHDFNDSVPISRLQMQQHPRTREVFFSDNYQRTKWYSLSPASLTNLFEGATATAYKPAWGQFVDTNDYDMPHYGIKYAVSELYTGINLYLEAKLIIDAKGIS